MVAGLDAAGLPWLQLHPEHGTGQFELSLAPGDPLQAADRLVAARLVIQRISSRFGLRWSFSPMLAPDLVGNGGHLHLSATREERPLLGGGAGTGGLTGEGEALVAGLLEQLSALLPLACSLNVSFLRLIPAGPAGEPAQLELKVTDLSSNPNPYLLFGGVMAAIGEELSQAGLIASTRCWPLSGG